MANSGFRDAASILQPGQGNPVTRRGQRRAVPERSTLMHPAPAAASAPSSEEQRTPCGKISFSTHPGYALKSFPLYTFLSR